MTLKMNFLKTALLFSLLFTLSLQEPDGKCDEADELLPDTQDCTIFYECSPNLDPIEFECEDGLCWNDALQECDFTYNVPCCASWTTGAPPKPTTANGGSSALPFANE